MAFLDISNIKVEGVTVCYPSTILENKDYTTVPEDEREKFIHAIGIERHRVVEKGTITSDLCFEAAKHLLSKLKWEPSEIELLVFVSQTPDYKMPATSCVLQNRLGLPNSTMTIDISQGCSGYLYGLGVVGSILSMGTIKKALLLVGNTQSLNTNYGDKSVFPLFSDMGSATAIQFDTQSSDRIQLSYGTDGSGEETIMIPDGGYRHPVSPDSFLEEEFEGGIKRNRLNLVMKGDDVFAFVISNIPKYAKQMMEHFGVEKDKIDFYLLHHASKFIINKLIKKLAIPEGKAPIVLKDFGNSSNASIPLLLTTLVPEIENKELTLFATGFGVGLSLAVGILKLGHLKCCDKIEYVQ